MSNGDATPAGAAAPENAAAPKADLPVTGPLVGGVTLLLRGHDRNVGLSSATAGADERTVADPAGVPSGLGRSRPSASVPSSVPPGWAPMALFGSDLVMVAVAALWAFAGVGEWRWVGIGALLVVGCVQALVAWTLVRPGETGNAVNRGPQESPAAPRIRVHFVDETPRHRR